MTIQYYFSWHVSQSGKCGRRTPSKPFFWDAYNFLCNQVRYYPTLFEKYRSRLVYPPAIYMYFLVHSSVIIISMLQFWKSALFFKIAAENKVSYILQRRFVQSTTVGNSPRLLKPPVVKTYRIVHLKMLKEKFQREETRLLDLLKLWIHLFHSYWKLYQRYLNNQLLKSLENKA